MSEQENQTASKSALNTYQDKRRLWLGLAGLAILALCAMTSSQWLHDGGHAIIELLGFILMVIGVLGRAWCTLHIGERKANQVVATGPYSISRNPLYVFSTIAAAGAGAQTGTVTLALFFGVACWGAFQVVIRREEAYLSANFGADYHAYLAKVPRFWPNFSLFETRETLTIYPKRLANTLWDGAAFFLTIPLFEALEWAQNHGYVPALLNLW